MERERGGGPRWLAAVAVLVFSLLAFAQPAGAAVGDDQLASRDRADRAGLRLGTAAQSFHLDDPGYRKLILRQVNSITFENETKWQVIHPERDRYDFSKADRLARWAQRQGMKMRGHTLVWHAQNPDWLKNLQPTRDEAIDLLRDHIRTVVGHFRQKFPGLVTEWDVVNEPIDNDGDRRTNVWQRWIGDEYVALAFRFARRAAGPKVELYLNDYYDDALMAAVEATGGEFDDFDPEPATTPGARGSLTCPEVIKCAATMTLVKGLLKQKAPVDGIGFQAHMFGGDPPDYRGLTKWVGDLGLKWAITEADVPVLANPGEAMLAKQASTFATALKSCLDDPACDNYVTWGLSDKYTWWNHLSGGIFPNALPFDSDLRPRPAAFAIDQNLAAAPRARCQRAKRANFRFRLAKRARVRVLSATANGVPVSARRIRRAVVRVSLARIVGADATVRLKVRVLRPDGRRNVTRSREVHTCVNPRVG